MPEKVTRFAVPAACLLLALFTFQGAHLIRTTSPTMDEVPFHMVNGYVNIMTNDYRMNPSAPPFIREWMAIPWLKLQPVLDLGTPFWANAESHDFGRKFFYEDNRAIADKLLYSSRAMILALGVLLAWAIFSWSRKLYGSGAALVSLALFTLSPMVLAHSAVATVDIGAALFTFLAVYALWKHFREDKRGRFPSLATALLGLALASKYTSVILLPIFLLIYLLECRRKRAIVMYVLSVFLAFIAVWATYFFEYKPLLKDVPRVEEKIGYIGQISDTLMGGNPAAKQFFVRHALETPVPMPTWPLGMAGIIREHRAAGTHYFLGEWRHGFTHQYYLVAFLLKSTIAFLIFLLLRLIFLSKAGQSGREHVYLLVPVALVFVATAFDGTGRGARYVLGAIPFLCVWAGGVWTAGSGLKQRILQAFCVALLAAHAAACALIFPHPMAYFNAFAGGADKGYLYLRDSDLDWGQELKNLGVWTQANGVTRIKTHLVGVRDEDFYGVPHHDVTGEEFIRPEKELYAISAYTLDHFKWTYAVKPAHKIGYAIFIYDFRDKNG